MKQRLFALALLLVLHAHFACGQGGFYLSPGKTKAEIPFEYQNNFIIVTLIFNGKLPLKFIFDTGAEYTILTKREIADVLSIQFDREFRIIGSDMKTELVAYLARRVRFDIEGKIVAPREDILVLHEDYFRFEEYAGVNIHGILAANVFSKYIIKINYQRRVIELFDRETFKTPDSSYDAIPIEMFRNKLYLNTRLEVLPDSVASVKLLIDTGAGLPLLLFTNSHALLNPPKTAIPGNIGMGLGGFLEGYNGRVHHLEIGKFEQKSIISQFQHLDSLSDREHLNNRNGLIGNVILNRFVVILDYQGEKIWLKPTKNYAKAFKYDRSGLSLIVSGGDLSRFTVQNVLPGSPAFESGFLKGDQITRVGWIPVSLLSLTDILRKLEGNPGKKVKLMIKRDGKKMLKTVVLRDLL